MREELICPITDNVIADPAAELHEPKFSPSLTPSSLNLNDRQRALSKLSKAAMVPTAWSTDRRWS